MTDRSTGDVEQAVAAHRRIARIESAIAYLEEARVAMRNAGFFERNPDAQDQIEKLIAALQAEA